MPKNPKSLKSLAIERFLSGRSTIATPTPETLLDPFSSK